MRAGRPEPSLSSRDRRVLIIGAGPAGLFAAIRAVRAGARVTILERMPRPGLKLLASGGGRANITNTLEEADFIARFGRQGRFMTPALRALSRDALLRLFASWGVPCSAADGFHYFPRSQCAADVLGALRGQLEVPKVRFCLDARAAELLIRQGRILGARADAGGRTGVEFPADAVILATGGAGYGGLGGCRDGYELARGAGHEIVPPVPGLVGLRTRESWPGGCAGVVVPDSALRLLQGGRARRAWRGDLLFTHHGISGPCVLDASATICRLLEDEKEAAARLQIADPRQGGLSAQDAPGASDWAGLLARWRKDHGRKTIQNLMAGLMPRRLAVALCETEAIPGSLTAASLPKAMEKRLLAILEGPQVHLIGSEGFERAMVTAGGVSLKEVHPATLESCLVSGLYFAGEVLDLDGPTGGFNLQWAMSSGWLAGGGAAMPGRG